MLKPLTAWLVTTWEKPCGIAEYARYLFSAVKAADPAIRIGIEQDLHPHAVLDSADRHPDVLVLNYHAALHSQWTAQHVRAVQEHMACPVVIIYHDTGVPNSDQAKALHAVADRFVVHEPCEDLPGAIYLRQGVPDAPAYDLHGNWSPGKALFKAYPSQPLLGTVGFPFPWKNYDLLVDATAEAGWALLLLAPGADESQISTWRVRNPHMLVVPDFVPAETVVAYLGGCDATAFLYTCANTGTSGAIRQGLAARKPVLAARGCRQFRDLELEGDALHWLDDLSVPGVVCALLDVPLQRVSPPVVYVAERDSWRRRGVDYARLFRAVVEGRGEDGVGHTPEAQQAEGQRPVPVAGGYYPCDAHGGHFGHPCPDEGLRP